MSRFLAALAALVAVYLLVLASLAPWDVVFGILLGAALLWAASGFVFGGRPAPSPGLASRIVAFLPFAVVVLRDILRGTWDVALVVLHLRPLRRPGIVAVPIVDRTSLGVTISALVTTLSPGAFLVDIDEADRVMLIHVLDASDPDKVREDHQAFYRRYQRHVFP